MKLICSSCKAEKDELAFTVNMKNRKRGCRSYSCRKCNYSNAATVAARDSALMRSNKLGVSNSQYAQLIQDCKGRCPICDIKLVQAGNNNARATVFMDKDSDIILGALCKKCDTALHLLGMNKEILEKITEFCTPLKEQK